MEQARYSQGEAVAVIRSIIENGQSKLMGATMSSGNSEQIAARRASLDAVYLTTLLAHLIDPKAPKPPEA